MTAKHIRLMQANIVLPPSSPNLHYCLHGLIKAVKNTSPTDGFITTCIRNAEETTGKQNNMRRHQFDANNGVGMKTT